MLKELVEFRETEKLIPNTSVQMLDFGLKISVLEQKKVQREFWPEITPPTPTEPERETFTLHAVEEVEDAYGEFRRMTLAGPNETASLIRDDHRTYIVKAAKALEIYNGVWLPAPFFRLKDKANVHAPEFEQGPTDWARIQVIKLAEPDRDGNTHRVTLAFDTRLLERKRDGAYAAPDLSDPQGSVFALAVDPIVNRGYIGAGWPRQWLREAYLTFANRGKSDKKRLTAEDLHNPDKMDDLGEYWGAYQVLLDAVVAACRVPRIGFVDTVKALKLDPNARVGVDLMIDVGNNRTCGMYIERHPDEDHVDITAAQRIELRDLTRPAHVYNEPFQSVVEFYPAHFGFDALARGSKRPRPYSFFWPSPVRVGPEAARLSTFSDGTEGVTGMSSPKRYLWDNRARVSPWVNNPGAPRLPGRGTPRVQGPMVALLAEDGKIASPDNPVGLQPLFSRASIYTLMLAEILLHVICQMNSVGTRRLRRNGDLPRVLNRLVLTLPTATPVAEQRAMRKLAENALALVWRTMGWPEDREAALAAEPQDSLFRKPSIELNWDEASCTHLVYLYNEVNVRFRGTPNELFQIIGRGRKTDKGPAVRIASIDIGGGTTDLMIIQHEVQGQKIITPNQIFREGFKQAGDDIVKVVAEMCVMPAMRAALEAAGVSQASSLLARLFGGDRDELATPKRTLRALFVNQVIVPAALGLLSRYEKVDLRRPDVSETLMLGALLPADKPVATSVTHYLEHEANLLGAAGFSVRDVPITFDVALMTGAISSVIRPMVENLCDVVRAYDCDVLLLSGRPSRLPVFREMFCAYAPVPLDQIVTLHDYEVGHWYPFRSLDNYISDPKTTAVVGAMLCDTCERGSEGFTMKSKNNLRMRSTARFIGAMVGDTLPKDNVAQSDLDPDSDRLMDDRAEFDIVMEGPFFIGFRQLPIERWPATPLMWVQFRGGEDTERTIHVPVDVKFGRQDRVDGKDRNDQRAKADAAMETFKLVEAIDADENSVKRYIVERMQTLRVNDEGGTGYWLDTGTLDTRRGEHLGAE